jgi:hypothetical protein
VQVDRRREGVDPLDERQEVLERAARGDVLDPDREHRTTLAEREVDLAGGDLFEALETSTSIALLLAIAARICSVQVSVPTMSSGAIQHV